MSQFYVSSTGGAGPTVISATGQTVGAQTVTVYSLDLGATAKTFVIVVAGAAYESTGPNSAGYQVFGTVRTDGTTATLIGSDSTTFQEDPALVDCDLTITTSGNNMLIQAVGTAGLTVNFSINASITST